MRYIKLTDNLNVNEIVRDNEDGNKYTYIFGAEKWVRSAIMSNYEWPDSAVYGKYEVIPESQATELMDKQREHLRELYELSKVIAEIYHKNQVDKGGNPYIEHCNAVADSLESLEWKIVAMLHDICEDTEATPDDLSRMGFTTRIVNSVDIITRRDNENYMDYLARVKKDSNAWHVKMADLVNNMDLSRIPNPTGHDYARSDKYRRALAFLEN